MGACRSRLALFVCGLVAALASGPGCSRLQLQLHNSSAQKPSNVALYFSVETSDDEPVGGLTAESFRIYEDGQLISPFESKQTILNPEVAVVHYVVLLLDLSGSITESGSVQMLIDAAGAFTERVSRNLKVAVYGFDGGAKLIPISGFTSSSGAATGGLMRLRSFKARDPSTNLNGAVIEAAHVLEKKMASASQPLRFGTMVVFTDGTDRAHRVSEEEMQGVLDEANINVFAIGLGAEISTDALQRLGRTGFVRAEKQASIGQAFDAVASSIENAAKKFYLLSYCSPARAGKHELRVEVSARDQSGALSQEFDATGFGPTCDPTRSPSFRVGRILLKDRPK